MNGTPTANARRFAAIDAACAVGIGLLALSLYAGDSAARPRRAGGHPKIPVSRLRARNGASAGLPALRDAVASLRKAADRHHCVSCQPLFGDDGGARLRAELRDRQADWRRPLDITVRRGRSRHRLQLLDRRRVRGGLRTRRSDGCPDDVAASEVGSAWRDRASPGSGRRLRARHGKPSHARRARPGGRVLRPLARSSNPDAAKHPRDRAHPLPGRRAIRLHHHPHASAGAVPGEQRVVGASSSSLSSLRSALPDNASPSR